MNQRFSRREVLKGTGAQPDPMRGRRRQLSVKYRAEGRWIDSGGVDADLGRGGRVDER
jgi:hypothetical protein